MIIKSNAHTHTVFCDGKNTPREMIEAAIKKGFSAIGFSGHIHFEPDETSMSAQNQTEYIKEITSLKAEYKGRIAVFCGIEREYYATDIPNGLDYVIGSVHYIKGDDAKLYPVDQSKQSFAAAIAEGFGGNAVKFVERYYETYAEMLDKVNPDIAGHFDLVRKFNHNNAFFDENGEEYMAAARKALKPYANRLFEVNTGGIWRGYRTAPYPEMWALKEIKAGGGSVIVTSDAHAAAGLDCFFDEAHRMIKTAGFEQETVLSENGFVTQKI